MQDETAASFVHEFNNVLMAIQPYAEFIRKQGASDERIIYAAERIIEAVDRGRRLTRDVLNSQRL